MRAIAQELVSLLNLSVLEQVDLPASPERRANLPAPLLNGPLGAALRQAHPDGSVWAHQALALEKLGAGANLVVATGTGSGKSLVFQYRALDLISRNKKARVIVFYPLKALASDQFARWREMCQRFGISPDAVARIDGDVPAHERDAAMERSNIVLMTPDVCQAWFMRNVGSGVMRRFLENLSLLVLDEAHVYESVFGSNVAFLLRRLISAKRHVSRAAEAAANFQVLAATATIADPEDHLSKLTGLPFEVVDDSANGAPRHERTLLHVNGAEYGASGEQALKDVIKGIVALSSRRRFIAFIDSRQGTERVVREVGSDEVLPYRSGYEAEDRKLIEQKLRDGSLHGVVSTSALELGIDIPDMEIGVNLGIPSTRKAFRQRIGRVGRSRPGLFLVIATPAAFTKYGQTFAEYYEGSVEPSYLYTGNRFIQFAHARCLWDEMEVIRQDGSGPPKGVDWPADFEKSLKIAKPGMGRPREFDYIAQLGGDSPHFNYPLRQIGEASYELKHGRGDYSGKIGNIAGNQALREAYPGANYLHFGKSYKVMQWMASSFERSIRIEPAMSHVPTRPLLRKTVNLALDHQSVIQDRIRRNDNGLLAETNLQVNESVEGYRIGSTSYLYRDLRAENPNMSRKQRDIRTTGAVIMIDEPWFSGSKGDAPANREAIATALLGVLSRERSISPQDIDFTSTNIAILGEQGPRRVSNCIVIYDVVYGGIRLTEELFDKFGDYVDQIHRAADLAGSEAIVSKELAERLKAWAETLQAGDAEELHVPATPDGWYQVFRPGSVVSTYHNGSLVNRELITPRLVDITGEGNPSLFYSYKIGGKQQVVAHEQLSPVGEDWSYVLWNPETNEFCELDVEGQEGAPATAQPDWRKVYRPGTRFRIRKHDRYEEREIVEPRITHDPETGEARLEYVFIEGGGRGYIPHSQVEPTGSDWSLVLWDPKGNGFKEMEA